MTADAVREALSRMVTTEGGWGYLANQRANLEPTSLVMIALGADVTKHQVVLQKALLYLATQSQPDGSYRLSHGRPQAAWTTSLVLMAKTALNSDAADRAKMVERLLAIEGRVVKADPEVEDMIDIDFQLVGWPWAEDTFSWVEPTSWACLALRAAGKGGELRVQEGLRLILDRAFATGGVNYGNRTVLGKPTEPIPGPTAMMLLALQGIEDPRIDAALCYLRMHAAKTTDLEHLAWIKIALSLYPHDTATREALTKIDERIRESLAIELPLTNGLGGGPLRLALAAIALETDIRHPFRLMDKPIVGSGTSLGSTRKPTEPGDHIEKEAQKPFGERMKSKVFKFLMGGVSTFRPAPGTAAVHIGRVENYDGDLLGLLTTQFAHYREHVSIQGKRVVLKPNLVEYNRDKVINTDPRFVDAVIQLFKNEGAAEIIIAEGQGIGEMFSFWSTSPAWGMCFENTQYASWISTTMSRSRCPTSAGRRA